jgi:hypothetical protein
MARGIDRRLFYGVARATLPLACHTAVDSIQPARYHLRPWDFRYTTMALGVPLSDYEGLHLQYLLDQGLARKIFGS